MTTTASDQLLEALGLPLDTDVIEWHTYVPPDPSTETPPPDVIGSVPTTGLVGWYRAADGATWTDRSGAGNHGTPGNGTTGQAPVWEATAGPNGTPAWRFYSHVGAGAGSGTIVTLPNLLAGAAAGEVFVKIKKNPTGDSRDGLWWWNTAVGTNDGCYFVYDDRVYENFGLRTGQRQNWVKLNQAMKDLGWLTYNVWAAPNDWSARIDGVTQANYAGSAGPLWNTAPEIGKTRPRSNVNENLDGWISELLVYNRKLTSTERAAVEAYLDDAAPPPPPPPPAASGWLLDPDRTAALADYTTVHGRPTPLENTSPLQAKVRLARFLQGDQVPTVGERFRLTLNADVATALGVAEDERPRFTGTITDSDIVPDRRDPTTGTTTLIELTGVGRAARLGSTPIKKLNRPGELDGERVRRILYAAAITLPIDLGTIDAGVRQLLALAAVNQSAKALVDDVIADTLGQLVEHRSGRLDWHDAEHRRAALSLVSLSGDQHLIQPFKWSQAIGTIVNTAQVTWGEPPAVETVRDPVSVDELGPYGVQLDTALAEASDAASLAGTIVGRYSRPAWMIPALTVDVVRTAGATAGTVLALSYGDKITAAGLPPDGAFTDGDLFVEGTTETFTRTAWRISLAVADPAIAGVGLRWIDIPATETWDSLAPLTWLQLATAAPEDL